MSITEELLIFERVLILLCVCVCVLKVLIVWRGSISVEVYFSSLTYVGIDQ
jgi:hypothetical protein